MKVLLIEDNPGDIGLVMEHLAEMPSLSATVEVAGSLSDGLERLAEGGIDIVLLDLSLPDSLGLATLDKIRVRAPAIAVIVLTGSADEETGLRAIRQGADDYVVKGPEVTGKILSRILRYAVERKRVEQALLAAEEKYHTIVETANEGIWLLDENMIISYVNPKMAQLLGYSPEEIVGRSPFAFADEAWQKSMVEYLEQRRRGIGGHHEGRLLRKDGTSFYTLISATPLLDANGRYRGQVSIHTDISERKRLEEELRKWGRVFEHASWGMVITGGNPTTYDAVNPAFAAMHGYTVEELRGKPIVDLLAPEHRAALPEEIRLATEQGHYVYESKHLRKDGSVFPVLADVTAVKDEAGTVLYRCANVQDITERKAAREELQRTVEQLEHILQCTIEGLSSTIEMKDPYTAGHQRRVTLLSCAIARELGLSAPRIDAVRKAGLVHDIGKMAVPNEVLSTPRRLSDLEMSLIRIHPQAGYDVLRTIPFGIPVAQIVLQHHERMDGSGYPLGLRGNEILLEARILAVADTVEAESSHRPYRAALGVLTALDEITKGAGVLYDREVVDACVALFQKKSFKFE